MNQLISTFHIELKLLIAQVVNFSIVLFVLYKFAYGPILKAMNSRTRKIEKGIKDAEEAKKKLEEIAVSEKEILTKARKESQEIIRKAEETAKKEAAGIVEEARTQTDKMVTQAKAQIEQEKEKTVTEIKGELSGLIAAAAGKILDEKLDGEKDKELIENTISELK